MVSIPSPHTLNRRRPRWATSIAAAMAAACWALAAGHLLAGGAPIAVGVTVIAGYMMLWDWITSPRGHEATVALRLGIKIGRLKRQ